VGWVAFVQEEHPFRSVSFDERRNQGVEKETTKGGRGKKEKKVKKKEKKTKKDKKKEVFIGQQPAVNS
jgi:hypothetical protein